MVTPELLEYIKKQLETGKNKEELRGILLGAGWAINDIEEAYSKTAPSPAPPPDLGNVPQASIAKEPQRKSNLLFFVIPLVIILIGAGGTFAYFQLSKLEPEEVLAKMFDALSQVKSGKFSGEINAQINGMGLDDIAQSESRDELAREGLGASFNASVGSFLDDFSATIYFEGASDNIDPGEPKARMKIGADIDSSIFSGKLFEYEMVNIDKENIYFKINNLLFLGFALEDLLNQWILINLDDLEKNLSAYFPPNELAIIIDQYNLEKNNERQKRIANELVEALKDFPIYFITEVLKEKEVGEVKVYHYNFSINKDNLIQIISVSLEIAAREFGEEIIGTTLSPEEMVKELREVLNFIDPIEGEIMIGKKDFLPYESKFNLGLNTRQGKGVGSLSIIIDYENYDLPQNINAPAQSIPFEEAFEQLFGTSTPFTPLLMGENTSTLDN